MKFFTLFSGKEIRKTEGKVIPSKSFASLLSAQELLKTVKQEALAFRKEVAAEAEKARELAYQEGHQEGLKLFHEHLRLLEREVKRIEAEVHQKILPLALLAAKKIVGEELKLHPDRIVEIVMQAIRPATRHRKVILYLNPADLAAIEKRKGEIERLFEELDTLSIQARSDVESGGCIIQTEAGIINAQLENQWRALEAAFQSMKS